MSDLVSRINTVRNEKSRYILLGAFAAIIILFIWYSGFEGTAGSARYLLSAIGQSLATILALSFTIPLIALQLVASKYGIKVYELYFDKFTILFMCFTAFSTFFPFLVLSKINEPDNVGLTWIHNIYVTLALVFTVTVLFFLMAFILHSMEKLKPENIIDAYVKEIKNAISKDELSIAHKKVETLKNIGIAAALEKDDVVFGEFLTAWVDLLMFEKVAWIGNVLENTFPHIFKIVAKDDETVAKLGLNKLEVIVLNSVEKKEIEKAKRIVSLFPRIIGPLIDSNSEVVRSSFYTLRTIGQMSIIIGRNFESSLEVSIESIHALRDIGETTKFSKPELAKEGIHEILNIITQSISIETIVKEGIEAIAHFKGFYLGSNGFLPRELSLEIKKEAINELIHLLDIISTESIPAEYKIKIANLIVPHIEIHTSNPWLIIIASRFLKDDENRAEGLLNNIAKVIKKAGSLRESVAKAGEFNRKFMFGLPIEDFERKYLTT